MSKIKIFCANCKEDILRSDTNVLKTPLMGDMFTIKPGMEWDIFAPSATRNDLVCPLCGWCFHQDEVLTFEPIEPQHVSETTMPEPVNSEEDKVRALFAEIKRGSGRGKRDAKGI